MCDCIECTVNKQTHKTITDS